MNDTATANAVNACVDADHVETRSLDKPCGRRSTVFDRRPGSGSTRIPPNVTRRSGPNEAGHPTQGAVSRMSIAGIARRLPSKIATKLGKARASLFGRLLKRSVAVRHDGRRIFVMRNYSWTTEKRARTFSTKEPETLKWIDEFEPGDVLMDIGANVGIYTLYAASRGHRVIALEPDALNFALLNMNIRDNGFDELVTAYPYSMHREPLVAELHMRDCVWGGSQKSFARNVDEKGHALEAPFEQGSAGISLDRFVDETGVCPTHLKIDVDGNETLVLEGATETLSNSQLRSILVELFSEHDEYEHCVRLIEGAGFKLTVRAAWAKAARKHTSTTENHIFTR